MVHQAAHQLAIDIGGTKTLAALVKGADVAAEKQIATPRHLPAEHWCDAIDDLVRDWSGRYDGAGVAVTGLVRGGVWSALNPAILPVPGGFPLEQALRRRLNVPVRALNDGQAAAWGEHRFGAGKGRDLFYLTISTGIGGGAIVDGKLLTGRHGLAGHAGQLRLSGGEPPLRIEDMASGQWMAAEAQRAGHGGSAQAIFEAVQAGAAWADGIVQRSAGAAALLCRNIQLLIDPGVIVIGGSVGLADGYLGRIRSLLAALPLVERPEVLASGLGKYAGVIGAADSVRSLINAGGGKT